eukprot:Phypoly_transcript_08346.p2 GENE.Phypoly_transcript_08346~~Phypoly_transcript_08346.p2  ORF type:complete len:205 (+),score=46.97 Phypoly_transcript_08346:813-1427(+)
MGVEEMDEIEQEGIEEELKGMEDLVEEVEGLIAQLEGLIAGEGVDEELQQQLNDLKGDLEELKNDVEGVRESIEGVEEGLQEISDGLKELGEGRAEGVEKVTSGLKKVESGLAYAYKSASDIDLIEAAVKGTATGAIGIVGVAKGVVVGGVALTADIVEHYDTIIHKSTVSTLPSILDIEAKIQEDINKIRGLEKKLRKRQASV